MHASEPGAWDDVNAPALTEWQMKAEVYTGTDVTAWETQTDSSARVSGRLCVSMHYVFGVRRDLIVQGNETCRSCVCEGERLGVS